MSDRLPIAVLASGNGSNFQVLADAASAGALHVDIRLLLSDKPKANVLQRAKDCKIPNVAVQDLEKIVPHLQQCGAQLICLAGFMRILPPSIIAAFPHRIINIHPSLLPQFPGLHAVRQALDAGVKETGVTIHFVDEGVDTGPTILQQKVTIRSDDTEETLTKRIHAVEHRLYPMAVQLFAQNKIRVQNGEVAIMSD